MYLNVVGMISDYGVCENVPGKPRDRDQATMMPSSPYGGNRIWLVVGGSTQGHKFTASPDFDHTLWWDSPTSAAGWLRDQLTSVGLA